MFRKQQKEDRIAVKLSLNLPKEQQFIEGTRGAGRTLRTKQK